MVLLELLADSASSWWDDRRTVAVESRDEILARALESGFRAALSELGDPGGDRWRWENAHGANIYHTMRLPALYALALPVQGGPSTLSPSPAGVHGASGVVVGWAPRCARGPPIPAAVRQPASRTT
jgi:hypothetical protein